MQTIMLLTKMLRSSMALRYRSYREIIKGQVAYGYVSCFLVIKVCFNILRHMPWCQCTVVVEWLRLVHFYNFLHGIRLGFVIFCKLKKVYTVL